MHLVWTGALWVVGTILFAFDTVKTVSLLDGFLWVILRGHKVFAVAKNRTDDFEFEKLERDHGHRSLVQSRLHLIRPLALRRAIGVLYFVYVLVPANMIFVMIVWLSDPATRAGRSLALVLGVAAAVVAVCLLFNELAKALWFGQVYLRHWSLRIQEIFQRLGAAHLKKAPAIMNFFLIGVVVTAGFAALAAGLETYDPKSYSLGQGVRPSAISWIYLTIADGGEIHPVSGAAKMIRVIEWAAIIGVGGLTLMFASALD